MTPRNVLESLLADGMVMVTLDARREGVVVPEQFANDPQLRLNLSYRFGLPLEIDGEGVTATLTFANAPFQCTLPWGAVYMIVSHVGGQPVIFPEHIPADLVGDTSDVRAAPQRTAPKKPQFEIIPGEELATAAPAEAAEPASLPSQDGTTNESATPEGPQKKRGHLRVVK